MDITATRGRDNTSVISVSRITEGISTPYNLVANGVTKVEVKVGKVSISSDTNDVVLVGNNIHMKLGKLDLFAGKYELWIIAYSASEPSGVVLVGPSRESSITLMVNNI